MTSAWALGGLVVLVLVILIASHRPACQPLFRWLPLPLWCYALPILAGSLGWLPREPLVYRALTAALLPIALGFLLLSTNLPAIIRSGSQALLAMLVGAAGVMIGAPVGIWVLRSRLPVDAWKGAGSLAATWTGGTMNLLALRSMFATSDQVFASLIVVDAVIAYSWMALLVALSGAQEPINRWLHASDARTTPNVVVSDHDTRAVPQWSVLVTCGAIVLGLVGMAQVVAPRLPTGRFVNSASGWTVLLVTTLALILSLQPRIRRIGDTGHLVGYPCLYVVLAATGAQASVDALRAAPMWLLVGGITVFVHGAALVFAGRLLRIPLGILATVSQANIGGVVSAPLVGAVYRQDLVPIGLLLAIAANAVGTYLGLLSALLARVLTGQ